MYATLGNSLSPLAEALLLQWALLLVKNFMLLLWQERRKKEEQRENLVWGGHLYSFPCAQGHLTAGWLTRVDSASKRPHGNRSTGLDVAFAHITKNMYAVATIVS
jgi:hypothetical protein